VSSTERTRLRLGSPGLRPTKSNRDRWNEGKLLKPTGWGRRTSARGLERGTCRENQDPTLLTRSAASPANNPKKATDNCRKGRGNGRLKSSEAWGERKGGGGFAARHADRESAMNETPRKTRKLLWGTPRLTGQGRKISACWGKRRGILVFSAAASAQKKNRA